MGKILTMDGKVANGNPAQAVGILIDDPDTLITKRQAAQLIQSVGQQLADEFSANQKKLGENDTILANQIDALKERVDALEHLLAMRASSEVQ